MNEKRCVKKWIDETVKKAFFLTRNVFQQDIIIHGICFYLVDSDLLPLVRTLDIIFTETIEPREPVDFNNYILISLLNQLFITHMDIHKLYHELNF